MARFNPNRVSAPVLAAAKQWLEKCWLADGSVLSNEQLWTVAGLTDLRRNFNDRLDLSDKSFYEKLEGQVANAAPSSRRLMAELLWVLMLFQSNIGQEKKRKQIRTVWQWGGDQVPEGH